VSPRDVFQRPGALFCGHEVGPVRRHTSNQRECGKSGIGVDVGSPRFGNGGCLGTGHSYAARVVGKIEQTRVFLPVRTPGADRLGDVRPADAGKQIRLYLIGQYHVLQLSCVQSFAHRDTQSPLALPIPADGPPGFASRARTVTSRDAPVPVSSEQLIGVRFVRRVQPRPTELGWVSKLPMQKWQPRTDFRVGIRTYISSGIR